MSQIQLSPVFTAGLAAAIGTPYTAVIGTRNSAQNGFIPNPSGANSWPRPWLILYKGAQPASQVAAYATRQADLLVQWADGGNTAGATFTQTTNANDLTTIITPVAGASASGLATWFNYFVTADLAYDPAIVWSVMGSVGLPGSGADMVLGDTNIVAGLLYKAVWPIRWPSAWNF